MHAIIDYIAYTIEASDVFTADISDALYQSRRLVQGHYAGLWSVINPSDDFMIETAKHPYRVRVRYKNSDMCFSFGTVNPHVLVEFAGRSCEHLRRVGALDGVMRLGAERMCRVDCAVDIECDTTPDEFSSEVGSSRHATRSGIDDKSGKTRYIGSFNSDRFARVYRYNPPHDRAHLLRIEVVNRGDYAKLVAKMFCIAGNDKAIYACHKVFDWKHKNWNPEEKEVRKLSLPTIRREDVSTVNWLRDTVAPSIIRLHRKGEIDAQQWFDDNVVSKIT